MRQRLTITEVRRLLPNDFTAMKMIGCYFVFRHGQPMGGLCEHEATRKKIKDFIHEVCNDGHEVIRKPKG